MTNKDIYRSLGGLDPELIAKAAPAEKVQKRENTWVKWALLAACVALIVGTVIAVPMLREDDPIVPPAPSDSAEIAGSSSPSDSVDIVLPSPPEYSSYVYESYDAVHGALTNPFSIKYIQLRLEQENCGELYRQTLSDFSSGEIKVAVPQINGENIPLRDREGFSNITWFTSELYNLPWLWYHCSVNGQHLIVSIAYPSVIDRTELDSATSYYQVLKMISPNSPSPDNYKESSSYKNIYEKEITLGNGETATAMISEPNSGSRIYVSLYLDGMLVKLLGDKYLLTEDFLRMFSIAYMK